MSGLDLAQKPPPHVLTIAGSDSSGGAGIQADLKTIEAWKCYGSSVLTGLTAQNTQGVQAVHEVPTDFVVQQLKAVWEDQSPQAIKLGMLTSARTVSVLANFLASTPSGPSRPVVVLDPVMVSTSGHSLAGEEVMATMKRNLMDQVDWLTPNIPEAVALVGSARDSQVEDLRGMSGLLESLGEAAGVRNILLKGGHLPLSRAALSDLCPRVGDEAVNGGESHSAGPNMQVVWLDDDEDGECIEILEGYRATVNKTVAPGTQQWVVDLLWQQESESVTAFVSRLVDTTSTHGTGCTLSSALACSIAIQRAVSESSQSPIDSVGACRRAIEYTKAAISAAYSFGKGHGPLNHACLSYQRALPPPSPSNPHPFTSYLIRSNLPLWKSYVRHPFVVQLGKGTLPRECFEHYIKQDYLYLQHYARAHALGAYKATTFTDIAPFLSIAQHITRESKMHVAYCASFGISLAELEATPESAPCAAYARYIIDVGASGDVLDLYVAVASCLVGYGEVGVWLRRQEEKGEAKREGNLYRRWMEDYASDEFLGAVNRGIENLERRVAADPPSPERLARLTKIWHECVRLERDFWEMGLKVL